MAEQLDLTTPETTPDLTDWTVVDLYVNRDIPTIKVSVKSNITGRTRLIRYIPDPTDPAAEVRIRAGLSFINQGKFATIESKSLQRWLLEKLRDDGHLAPGTVSGTPE